MKRLSNPTRSAANSKRSGALVCLLGMLALVGCPAPEDDDTQSSLAPNSTPEPPPCAVGPETCDGLDNDCDGQIDQGLTQRTWYVDSDGDGVGSSTTSVACAQPPHTSSLTGDCDDADSSVHPGSHETCNGKDDDCDNEIDDGALETYYLDSDGDGYGSPTSTQVCPQSPNTSLQSGDYQGKPPALPGDS